MTDRPLRNLFLSIALATLAPPLLAGEPPHRHPKKVLVELFTTQGLKSSPPASDLLAKLPASGFGPSKIVALNFHVDSSNRPWPDPYSDASFARRQHDYNALLRRNDLASTPLLMIDGRTPLLAPDRSKAESALTRSLDESPAVDLHLDLDGTTTRKTLSIKVSALSPFVAGRPLLIGVALTEDPVSTRVLKGENAGKTLFEHHVVRHFDRKTLTLDPSKPQLLTVPIDLPFDGVSSHFRVSAFVQDRDTGAVHQAESIPWTHSHALASKPPAPLIARRKPRRPASNWSSFLDPFLWNPPNEDGSMTCPACGNTFMPPLAPIHVKPGQMILVPSVSTC